MGIKLGRGAELMKRGIFSLHAAKAVGAGGISRILTGGSAERILLSILYAEQVEDSLMLVLDSICRGLYEY